MRKRLRERRQLKDETEYEVHAAMGMVLLAEQRLKAKENRSQANASKQRNLVRFLTRRFINDFVAPRCFHVGNEVE